MKVETGDIVVLSGPVMLKLAKDSPEVFDYLKENDCVGGEVVRVDGNTLHIDFGLADPVKVDYHGISGEADTVQILQKNHRDAGDCGPTVWPSAESFPVSEGGPQAPENACDYVPPQPPEVEGHPKNDVDGVREIGPGAYMVPRESLPEFLGKLGVPYSHSDSVCSPQTQRAAREQQEVLNQIDAMTRPTRPAPQQPPPHLDTARWVLAHFKEIKEFAIAQDIVFERGKRMMQQQDPDGFQELYCDNDKTPIRVELSAAETQLYEEALFSLRDWLQQQNSTMAKKSPE